MMIATMQKSALLVKIICGANDDYFPIAGATVGSARNNLVDAFNIPGNAIAFVDGQQVPSTHVLRENVTLEFVPQYGRKAGHPRLTEKDLNGLGLTVLGDQAVRSEDAIPDTSWALSQLLTYAKERIASSKSADKESILQAKKSAVELFRAGAALSLARAKCNELGKGEWSRWKREHDFADTTVNDAIRLYTNAKTEDALKGLGITEAKEKFVYPKDGTKKDDEPTKDTPAPTTQETTASDGAADADMEETDDELPPNSPRAHDDADYHSNLEAIENLLEVNLDSALPLAGLDECLTTAEKCRDKLDQVIARLKDKIAEVEPDSLSILEEE
ncbi:MAG TPA: hypothetical protein VHY91_13640 [Pirellulales bacterium]|jgi:hypothetical protein|nr:hypothetical protein [Pirellulales bacterium]